MSKETTLNQQDLSPTDFPVAIVAVTYKRAHLLKELLKSITEMTLMPEHVIIVDNDSQDDTSQVVESYRQALGTNSQGKDRLIYSLQAENTGGAGGFSVGTQIAYGTGNDWIWLMDDDVAVEPEALVRLAGWAKHFKVIQGRRYNFDGKPFYWQFDFNTRLGIPNPIARDNFGPEGYLPMNTVCFEGGLFHRSIVKQLGLPDPRFFIYWDDTVYGYLASKITQCVLVDEFILRRTRDIQHLDLKLRRLNGTSDMVRYHIMRNRGFMARYFALNGDYHRFSFGVGTALTAGKELVRIAAVDRSWKNGVKQIYRGIKAARKIYRDPHWKPMPPLS